ARRGGQPPRACLASPLPTRNRKVDGCRRSCAGVQRAGATGGWRMEVNKPHLEFHAVDMASGWSTPPGYPAGIEQKILAGSLDEERGGGSRTRLLRFRPG